MTRILTGTLENSHSWELSRLPDDRIERASRGLSTALLLHLRFHWFSVLIESTWEPEAMLHMK